MTTPTFSICVYCGSKPGNHSGFADVARAVGRWIGQHQGQLVYGGGHNGLMGILADSASDAGARVVGIIPQNMVEREWARTQCDELIVVETMHQRKNLMIERSDAIVALPGGVGTFDEFFEAWSWRQLGFHSKPVGLLNFDGYYDALLSFLKQSTADGFLADWQMDLVLVGQDHEVLLPQLIRAAKPS